MLVTIVGSPGPGQALSAFKQSFAFSAVCAVSCSLPALALGRVRVVATMPAQTEQVNGVIEG